MHEVGIVPMFSKRRGEARLISITAKEARPDVPGKGGDFFRSFSGPSEAVGSGEERFKEFQKRRDEIRSPLQGEFRGND